MNSIEEFRVLKEIFSLQLTKNQVLEVISSNTSRIKKLKDKKDEAFESLYKHEESNLLKDKQLKKCELELYENSKNLKQKMEQIKSLANDSVIQKMEQEITFLSQSKETLENSTLELMGEIEASESEMKDLNEYIQNIDKSIIEITIDVDQIVIDSKKEINIIDARIKNLITTLPPSFKTLYEQLMKKNFKGTPFTRIINLSCECCGMSLERQLLDDIDVRLIPTVCKGCKRLIFPSKI